jgi:hypothetical protein
MSARTDERAGTERPPADAFADFLRRMRLGIEDGLDPMSAANRAADELPKRLAETVRMLARRVSGDYHEDEWGFDEEFAEVVYPLFGRCWSPTTPVLCSHSTRR